jgi:plastocyanin
MVSESVQHRGGIVMKQGVRKGNWNFHNLTRRMVMRKTLLIAVLLVIGGAVAAHASMTAIVQSHQSFDRPALTIKAGDTIDFVNQDTVTHNIQIVDTSNNIKDEGLQKPGEKVTVTMSTPGQYKVRCAIHPKMRMTLVVQ